MTAGRVLGPWLAVALALAACDAADRAPAADSTPPEAAAVANDAPAQPAAPTANAANDGPATVFPQLTGRVVDGADLLEPEAEARLAALSEALERRTTDQLVIVTVPSLQGRDIADYSRELGNHWGIGQADRDNGVLLVVAPNERQVRIAVAYGLEPILTNARSAEIIDRDLLPAFRAGKWEEGVAAGAASIVRILTERAAEPRRGRP